MAEYFAPKPSPGARLNKTPKEHEKSEGRERKKCLLYLVLGYLKDVCLEDAAEALKVEAELGDQYEVCDNIDLDIILQDYQSYYQMKFGKVPKIIRRSAPDSSAPVKRKGLGTPQHKKIAAKPADCGDFHIDVVQLNQAKPDLDKPALSSFEGYSQEWREFADTVLKEIIPRRKLTTKFSDCIGLDCGIELLKEAVLHPMEHPELFTGLLTPWKGVLLYGPPGTGKTMLARALAGESGMATFINLTASTFVSKWRGDSEKMLRVLFDVARLYAPTTIFIDELDALASKYEDGQHDASRRFRSELLVQMDGLLDEDGKVFVLASTNSPWNLNGAILRRFEKRILLNVPSFKQRVEIFKYYFSKHKNKFKQDDYTKMGELTVDFSGADIKIICKESLMITVREKLTGFPDRSVTMDDFICSLQKINKTNAKEAIEKHEEWSKKYGSL